MLRVLDNGVTAALAGLAVVLIAWTAVSASGVVDSTLFPSPARTARAALAMIQSGVLADDLAMSLQRAAIGFLIGASLGILLGFITGRNPLIARLVSPIVSFLRPIPAIALIPLVTAWFGIGEEAKRIVIAYAVFLAVWLYVHDAVHRTPQIYLRVSDMFGIGRLRTWLTVLIPSAAPAIVTALRYGSSIAYLALVAAELGGTQQGVAYRIQVDGQFMQTDRMFVGLIVLGILGAVTDVVIAAIGRRVINWSE
ncbi:ABC transporter permease [Tsukamurella asaccharolytica]|uniref:ABC transporter permease n=1 Tax=Tsukamurella asaccharolytica TaxID=2592067 RepID=A0A5C5R5Q1_9ACTN|nr:ABC transporter permease [Tsukamurella asaccharolytica]